MLDRVEEFRCVTQRFFRRFGTLAAESTPCGKPLSMAHAHALMILRQRGEMTQRSLGSELCIDKSNVARLCAKMAQANHVKNRTNTQDGRSRLVSLTFSGARLAEEVDRASRARFTALLKAISAAHRNEVIAALQQLVDALEAPTVTSFGQSAC